MSTSQSLCSIENEPPEKRIKINENTPVLLVVESDSTAQPSDVSTITNTANSDCGLNSSFLSFTSDVEKDDVRSLLEATAVGRFLLEKSDQKQKLNNRDRNNICEIIITHYLNKAQKLTNAAISKLADSIVKIFVLETKATYFVDPIPKSQSAINKSIPSRGKLVDKHRNLLTKLRRSLDYAELLPPSPISINPGITFIIYH